MHPQIWSQIRINPYHTERTRIIGIKTIAIHTSSYNQKSNQIGIKIFYFIQNITKHIVQQIWVKLSYVIKKNDVLFIQTLFYSLL